MSGSNIIKSIISSVELSQPISLCFKSQKGMELVGHIPDNQCNQTIDYQVTNNYPNDLPWYHPSSGIFFVCGTNAYLYLPAN